MKRVIEIVLKYGQILQRKLPPTSDVLPTAHSSVVNIALLKKTSIKTIKMLQQREFVKELRITKKAHKQNPNINGKNTVTKANPIYGHDPFLDDNGILRVGG